MHCSRSGRNAASCRAATCRTANRIYGRQPLVLLSDESCSLRTLRICVERPSTVARIDSRVFLRFYPPFFIFYSFYFLADSTSMASIWSNICRPTRRNDVTTSQPATLRVARSPNNCAVFAAQSQTFVTGSSVVTSQKLGAVLTSQERFLLLAAL